MSWQDEHLKQVAEFHYVGGESITSPRTGEAMKSTMKPGDTMFMANEFLNSDRWLRANNEDNTFLRQQQAVAAFAEEVERLVLARIEAEEP